MAVDAGSAQAYLDIDISKYVANLDKAISQTRSAKNNIESVGDKVSGVGKSIESVGSTLTKTVTAPIVGLATAAIKTTADFQTSMSSVAAISGATGDELDQLTAKAREMGAKTKFSASESADAFKYMAMAGWKTADMLDGIEGIMNLAAASGEDLATTSDIVTDALTAFGLTASDSAHFADVMAAASNNANTNVSLMGETFKYVAPIAGSMGYSIEDTAEAIGLLANSGIKGSQAGTTLRTIMTKLNGEIKLTGESLGEVTIQTTKSDGSMRSLQEILTDCRSAFSQLSESEQINAAKTLVGQEAMSGFLTLMNAAPGDIAKLRNALSEADGTAQSMATTMQDNLTGQLTVLKSSIEELAISFGTLLLPTVQNVVSHIQGFVDKLNSMDEGQKNTIIRIAEVVAVVGPVILIVGKLTSAVGSAISVVGKIGGALGKFSSAASSTVGPATSAAGGMKAVATSALNLLAAGAGILMAAAGLALLANAAIKIASAGWPAAAALGGLVAGLALLAVGAAAVGPALTAGAVGLVAFGAAVALIGVGVLAATAGIAILAPKLSEIAANGAAAGAALVALSSGLLAFAGPAVLVGASLVTVGAGLATVGAGGVIAAAGILVLDVAVIGLAASCGLLAIALDASATSVESIESSASSAANSLTDMVTSVDVVKAGLDALGSLAQNAVNSFISAFTSGGASASSAAAGIATGIQTGLSTIPSDTASIMSATNDVITSGMNQAVSTTSSASAEIVSETDSMMSGMQSSVSSGMSSINSIIRSGFSSAVSYIRSLAGQSYGWGADMMQGIINGIYSRMGALSAAVGAVASTIRSKLHFSRPDEGPLRDYETWMPDFMEGLASGIDSNAYRVENSIGRVTDSLTLSPKYDSDGIFGDSAIEGMKDYNIVLINTIELYRQLNEQMRMYASYSSVFSVEDNGLLGRNDTPKDSDPTTGGNPGNKTAENKPDQIVIPITIGEEQIETVVVDLLKREVRT